MSPVMSFVQEYRSHLSSILRYALSSGCDTEQVWVDVCMGRDETSTPHFRAFLCEYVKRSVTYRPCLDAREWHEVQTIKQASTIQDVWATLVKAADLKVISPRRKAEPLDGRWSLDYSSQKRGSRNTTICEVGKVRLTTLLIHAFLTLIF